MSSWRLKGMVGGLAMAVAVAAGAQGLRQAQAERAGARVGFAGIGRAATPAEVKAWDIDVRPDFKGLPKGHGSVDQGQEVWEGKCASCHGVFGESNEVFNPLVGGTTAEDIKTGHVANLKRRDYPGRTTLMKVSQVSTLWDYINRAMPWNAPKSLKTDEVYAVLAYLLNLGGIVPNDFTLSDANIAEVQQRLPNRNGVTTAHDLWPGKEFGGTGKPDVQAAACMKNCPVDTRIVSELPAFAMNNNGNLADQNRLVGPQRGIQTAKREATADDAKPQARAAEADAAKVKSILEANSCLACHAMDHKVVGPAFADVAKKYPGQVDYLAGKIRSGGSGVWGGIPMPPQSLSDADLRRVADWLAKGAH